MNGIPSVTGLLNSSVLFYGKNSSDVEKVFGIENLWGAKNRFESYISEMKYFNNIMFPCKTLAGSTTKYCDIFYFNNSGTRYYCAGGYASEGQETKGIFCC